MSDFVKTKCVTCGRTREVKIEDKATWYRERHPTLNIDDPVPLKCLDCYQDFEIGTQVKVRFHFGDAHRATEGESGIVNCIYSSGAGKIYEVKFDTPEKTDLFTRLELGPVK